MAVAFRDSTVAVQASNATWAVSRPTLAVAGDFLLAVLVIDSNVATMTTVPSPWTAITGTPKDNTPGTADVRMFAYWCLCPASPPASWSWVFSAAVVGAKAMVAYSGADQTTPVNAQQHAGTAVATTHTTTAITTTAADCMLVIGAGSDESATFTPYYTPPTTPSAWTERIDFEAASSFVELGVMDFLLTGTVTGATYTYTHLDSDGGVHVIVAIAPAAGAAATSLPPRRRVNTLVRM